MKKLILTAVIAIFSLGVNAQTNGIKFMTGTLSEVQAEAEKTNKLVFVDIYATWCNPCKFLSTEIFPNVKVGRFMNAKFVSAKFDAEQGEGISIVEKFNIKSYPTMLILNSDGEEVGRIVGIERTPEAFIQRVDNASK